MGIAKKILIIIFFIIFLFKYLNSLDLKAQEIEQLDKLLKTSCKIGEACCFSESLSIRLPKIGDDLPFPLDKIIDQTQGAINFIMDNAVNRFLGPISNFLKNMFGVRRPFCQEGFPSSEQESGCFCIDSRKPLNYYCINIESQNERSECIKCVSGDQQDSKQNKFGVWTVLGCISGDLGTFIKEKIFGLGVGLAGMIALFCIIYAAVQIQTSQGSPEKIKKAQELLTSCIMGLMLIIFSVFILKLIGVNILRIPGFGE